MEGRRFMMLRFQKKLRIIKNFINWFGIFLNSKHYRQAGSIEADIWVSVQLNQSVI